MSDLQILLNSTVAYCSLEETSKLQQQEGAIELVATQVADVIAALSSDLLDKVVAEVLQSDVEGCINNLPEAEKLKAAGNTAFAAQKFAQAAWHYSDSLRFLNPADPAHSDLHAVLLCNRALCMAKLGNHRGALGDSAAAAAAVPTNPTAHFRAAAAHAR